jgi:ABC-type sugar transport system ATPase subunit
MDGPEEIYARPATLFVATFIGTMNRLVADLDADGRLRAGPFRVVAPEGISSASDSALVAGVRPEDVILESGGEGSAARIDQVVDLGHYRRVTLSTAEQASLLAFVPKADALPSESVTVRARRVLVYADGRLAGVSEPLAGAAVPA